MTDLPLWRSMLFVPATAERFVEKAHTRDADAIYIDLEDAVAASEKPRARTLVRSVAQTVGQGGAAVLVRVNRPMRLAIPDLEASIWPEVGGVLIPKVENAAHVRLLSEAIDELERERGIAVGATRLVALIETAEGFRNVREIAGCPRMTGITLGGEDFADAMGMTEARADLILPYLRDIVLAAREAGILALGYAGSIANFTDLDAYGADVRLARAMGFDGGSCIHPAQVPILNEAFAPTEDEIAQSERIVQAYDAALERGEGAIELDGKMIDVPVANRARRILERQRRILSIPSSEGR